MMNEVTDVTEEKNDSLEELINQVASRCYVTSDDQLIKDRLSLVVKNAIFSVSSLLGMEDDEKFDYSKPSMENELFLNYCMYRWNNRTQKEFESNYIGDIIAIRSKREVEYGRKKKEEVKSEGQL